MKEVSNKWIRASSSGIHNQGVFAKINIPKDTYIIEYKGKKLTKKASTKLALEWEEEAREKGEANEGLVYIFELNKRYDIDGNYPDNVARLINHSCDDSCESVIYDGGIWIVATRDIKKGDELSYDYGFDMSHFIDHPCLCGSDNCLGYIVSKDQRKKVRKYLVKHKTPKKAWKALSKKLESKGK